MSTGHISFVAFKPHASRSEKYKDRSQASRHTSRVSSRKTSELRLDNLRKSVHSSTKSIASWQAPSTPSSETELTLVSPNSPISPPLTCTDAKPFSITSPSPSPVTSQTSSDQLMIGSEEFGTPWRILQYLETEDPLAASPVGDTSIEANSSPTPPTEPCNDLYEQSRSMVLLGIGASVTAKASPRCNYAQQTSLGMRLQLIRFIRGLVERRRSSERARFAYLLAIYGLFKMECIECNTSAAQYHAKALEALFHSEMYDPETLAQILGDDVGFEIHNNDSAPPNVHETGVQSPMIPSGLHTVRPKSSSIRVLAHPGITYKHLSHTWCSLRRRVEEMHCGSLAGSNGNADLETSLHVLLHQLQLNNMREDLIDGIVMQGTSLHKRLHQAAMAVVLHILSIGAFGSLYTNGPTLEGLLSKLRDLLAYISELTAVMCCTTSGVDQALEESKLFALFVGSVMEYRLQSTTSQLATERCHPSIFATMLSRTSTALGVDSANGMQQLAVMFWPPELLSCNFGSPGWSSP